MFCLCFVVFCCILLCFIVFYCVLLCFIVFYCVLWLIWLIWCEDLYNLNLIMKRYSFFFTNYFVFHFIMSVSFQFNDLNLDQDWFGSGLDW